MSNLGKLFTFNRHDRDAIIVLLLVIITSVVLIPLLADKDRNENKKHDNPSYRRTDGKRDLYYAVPEEKHKLFTFDPNTADSTQLLALGLKPWQVRSIYKYRAKGGRFRKPTDFARLYGLTLKQYKQLEPYISIAPEPMARDYYPSDSRQDNRDYKDNDKSSGHQYNSGNQQTAVYKEQNAKPGVTENATTPHPATYERIQKLHPGETIDINTADTTQLKRIPGIGSYFARRIVDLRQRKGMFVSPEQLLSIRNFPEHSLSYMTASQNFPVIRINRATFEELRAHPLLNYTQAKDIMQLRRTSGPIHSAQDLSFIPSITQEQLKRLATFLSFE